jgi:hypothetical protein
LSNSKNEQQHFANIPILKSMRNRLFFLLLLLFFCNTLSAQKTEINGTVADSITHLPIEGVVVKAMLNQKLIAFSTTNKLGNYNLGFENQTRMITICFQHISYNTKTQNTVNSSSQINVSLSSKDLILREVSVAAPKVFLNKDTVSFNVASFKTAGDRSIEDVIKKLPGVEVDNDGRIAYQGKNISKFNIEGLDMLGGKYALASRNIQAKDVNRVEIIENYQEVKQLQGKEHSDKVALNLKLNDEAKMRLIGTEEVGGGYRENEMLYQGALTGMTFAKKLQFIGTLKANNWGSPLSNEIHNFYGNDNITNVAGGLVSSDLSSSPPLSKNRFQQKNELMTSINSLFKISDDRILRVNADYTRDQSEFHYETISSYFVNNSNVEIKEKQAPEFLKNALKTVVCYQINSPKIYLGNTTSFFASNEDNHFGLISNDNRIQQNSFNSLMGAQNQFSFLKKINKKQYNFSSLVSYSDMPNSRLTFIGVPDVTAEFYQTGSGKSFFTANGTSFGYDLSQVSQLSLSLSLQANYDQIHTQLQRDDSAILNSNQGYKITTSVSPEYRLLSLNQRYGFTLGLPVYFYNLGYINRINSNADFYYNTPFFSPKFSGHYIFSAYTKLEFNAGINSSIGDITDFVVNPIQSSYNQQSSKSGILAKNRGFSSQIDFELKNPLALFFTNYSVSYNNIKRNILSSQTVNTGVTNVVINTAGVADENTSQSLSVSGKASKDISDIGTTLSLRIGCDFSTGTQIRQGIKTDINTNSFSVSPNVRTQINKQFEVSYSMNYNQSMQNAVNYSTTYHQQSHGISLSYSPIDALVIYSSMDYSRREITTNMYKNMQLFDTGIRYNRKKFETELKLNNLLNTKQYSYTIVNQLDIFSYTYNLNPREVVLIFKLNL